MRPWEETMKHEMDDAELSDTGSEDGFLIPAQDVHKDNAIKESGIYTPRPRVPGSAEMPPNLALSSTRPVRIARVPSDVSHAVAAAANRKRKGGAAVAQNEPQQTWSGGQLSGFGPTIVQQQNHGMHHFRQVGGPEGLHPHVQLAQQQLRAAQLQAQLQAQVPSATTHRLARLQCPYIAGYIWFRG
jgi:hypothetical protein